VNFQTVITGHLIRIVQTSWRGEDLNKVCDHLYAMLIPYIDEEVDKKLWEDNVSTRDEYEYMLNKLRISVVILYRMGMLPIVSYENRVFEEKLAARRSHIDDMSKQVAEEINLRQVLMFHLMSMGVMYDKNMDHNMEMHVDVLWMFLTPYIVHEDMEEWETNFNTHEGNPAKYDRYYFIECKKRICMKVMDRAGFLWSRSVVDAEDVEMDEGRFLEDVGVSRVKMLMSATGNGGGDDSYDVFDYQDSDIIVEGE
jgi:hypothetical protein